MRKIFNILVIVLIGSLILSCIFVIQSLKSQLSLENPYYYCFTYTPDGMLFGGGDTDFNRAKKLVMNHCDTRTKLKSVLVKQILDVNDKEQVEYYSNY